MLAKRLAKLGLITRDELSMLETMIVLDSLSKFKSGSENLEATVKTLVNMLFNNEFN
jgi:hypothetical protein